MKVSEDDKIPPQATTEVITFLQHIWQLIEDGRVDTLQPDPFFKGTGKLTTSMVEIVVGEIEGVFVYELAHSGDYHKKHQLIEPGDKLVLPGYLEMPYPQKLALVQGVYKILEKHRV